MRRPAPRSLSDIRHPGPAAINRLPHARCLAKPLEISLAEQTPLLEALGRFATHQGLSSAVLDLSGLTLEAFDFVMPACAIDDRHAAWYSDTHSSKGATLESAVAILGIRDGEWFAHVHAYWHEEEVEHLGHLLPHTLKVAHQGAIKGYGLQGAAFVASLDPETEFTLFRVQQDDEQSRTTDHNALITTLAPFADLTDSIQELAKELKAPSYEVYGLGSLAGAAFRDAQPMTGLISEILLFANAGAKPEQELCIPIRAVDLDGGLHRGILTAGGAPTLITCELLIMTGSKDDLNPISETD